MALEKVNLPISFEKGINTKIDDNQLEIGEFKTLENVVFKSFKAIKKRNGYNLLSNTATTGLSFTGGSITNTKTVTSLNDELIRLTDTNLYSKRTENDNWINKGNVNSLSIETGSIKSAQTIDYVYQHSIYDNGLLHILHQNSTTVRYSVIDYSNKSIYLSGTAIITGNYGYNITKVINASSGERFIIVLYQSTAPALANTIVAQKYSWSGTAFTLVSTTNILTDVATGGIWDVIDYNNDFYITYRDTTNTFKISRFDYTMSSIDSYTESTPAFAAPSHISLAMDSSNRFIIGIYDGSDVYCQFLDTNLDQVAGSATKLTSTTISNYQAITIEETTTNNYDCLLSDESTYADEYTLVYRISFSNPLSISVSSRAVFGSSISVYSKPIDYNDTKVYLFKHVSTLQSTYFLMDLNYKIYGVFDKSTASQRHRPNTLPRISKVDDDNYFFATETISKNSSDGTAFFYNETISYCHITKSDINNYKNVQVGDNLLFSSGLITEYDSKSCFDNGFLFYPETVTASISGSGLLSTGNYQYVVVYAYLDENQQLHRSAPSLPVTIATTSGDRVRLDIDHIPYMNKSNAIIEIYRTVVNGTIFYRLGNSTTQISTSVTTPTITIYDPYADTAIDSNEVLYTEGGVLDNIQPESCTIIESFNNRVWIAGLPNKSKLQYSKIIKEGYPVEFNDTLYRLVPSKYGKITGLKELDDKIIIFTENAIYYMMGTGPNNLGEQDDFSDIELITNTVGCRDESSIVSTNDGIYFMSHKGIYLLNKQLTETYVGVMVEQYNDQTITSAVALTDRNEIRFTTQNSVTLVFNTLVQQWSTFTNHEALSATVCNDVYYYVRSNGDVYQQTTGYADNTTAIKRTIETGWMSFNGISNFMRVYRLKLLGKFVTAHQLKISVAYDYQNTYSHDIIISSSDFATLSTDLYQMSVDFKFQKCQALKLKIEDYDSITTEGAVLSNMNFRIGVKKSQGQNNNSNSYGVS